MSTIAASLRRWRTPFFAVLLAALGALIFHPVRHFEFLNFDDDLFLVNNPWLKRGITWDSLHWALTANLFTFSIRAEYWSPLTLLTRLFDAEFFGLNPGPHHVTSAVLHVVNALALFAALRSLTGAWWRSASVAVLFLVHPLNVEPVAWLSARKDLVSATFFFLTLAAYGRYAARQTRGRYAVVALAFFAGLMSKPMVVTTPAVLLLLDFWPLGRWSAAAGNRAQQTRLVLEKVPLFLLAAVAGFVAVLGQKDWGALQSVASYSLPLRVGNAVVSYATFLRRIFWPSDLAIFYPHPGATLSWWAVAGAAALLLAVTFAAVRLARPHGFALVGWLWFLGVLAPVIGLVQIGNQAMADRYAYPSAAGVLMALVWGVAELLRGREKLALAFAVPVIAALSVVSANQLQHWRDSESAFTHAIVVTTRNDTAFLNLGSAYFVKGDLVRARENFTESLEIQPLQANGWNNLAAVEDALGHDEAAVRDYAVALRMNPNATKAQFHLGKLLLKHGDTPRGEACLRRANEIEPGWPDPYLELGRSLAQRGEKAEAARLLTAYLTLRPNDIEARSLLRGLTE